MTNRPIACTLTPEQRKLRRSELLTGLARGAVSTELTPNGCRICFAASSAALTQLAQTIDAERQCCQFLEFRVTVPPGLGEMVLEVSGPEGTRDFLMDLLSGAVSTAQEP